MKNGTSWCRDLRGTDIFDHGLCVSVEKSRRKTQNSCGHGEGGDPTLKKTVCFQRRCPHHPTADIQVLSRQSRDGCFVEVFSKPWLVHKEISKRVHLILYSFLVSPNNWRFLEILCAHQITGRLKNAIWLIDFVLDLRMIPKYISREKKVSENLSPYKTRF